VVKIPSLSRRRETVPTRDENRDGRIDERDEQLAAEQTVAPTSPAAAGNTGADPVVTGRTARTGVTDRTDTTTRPAAAAIVEPGLERTVDTRTGTVADRTGGTDRTEPPAVTPDVDRTPDVEREPDVVVDRGPRPRASMLATLSLILGVVGVLFVLTGTLAGYGIGVGAVGALLAVGGLAATRRRHVAGRSESLIGLVLGLGAVVLGVLAMTGQFDWPNTDGDAVQRFREWLDAQFVNRF
jgi:hypothetical protein